MSFARPLALVGLVAVPVLVLLWIRYDRRRRAGAARFASLALVPNLIDRRPGRLRLVPPVLFLLALTALIVGMARPHANIKVPRHEATVVLAIDVSRSMKAQDVTPTRLDAAKEAANAFLAKVPKEYSVALVGFGSRAFVAVPPTLDRSLVSAGLDDLDPGEGTAIGDAVVLSAQLGQRQRAVDGTVPPTSVLLISDGAPDGGRTSRRGRHAQGAGAARSRVDGARGDAERHRHPEARRRLHRADPRAAEPRHADGDRARNRRRVLPGADEHRARRRVPASRHAYRPPHGEPGDHRPLRRRRDRAAARRRCALRASGSGGSREAARGARVRHRRAGRGRRRSGGRDERVQGPPGLRADRGPVGADVGGGGSRSTSFRARRSSSSPGSTPSSASRGIDVSFRGALGSPVNPGITTTTAAVFLGRLVRGTDPAASFRPHIGCIPASGGGQRLPTSLHVYPPSKPTLPRDDRDPGARWAPTVTSKRCARRRAAGRREPRDRLLHGRSAQRTLAASVAVAQTVGGGRLHVSIHGGPAAGEVRAVVQVDLLCVAAQ